MATVSYSKIALQKNGAVTRLRQDIIFPPTMLLPFSVQPGQTPQTANQNAQDALAGSVIDPAITSVEAEIAKHQIDIAVTIIGVILIIASIGALVKPFIP